MTDPGRIQDDLVAGRGGEAQASSYVLADEQLARPGGRLGDRGHWLGEDDCLADQLPGDPDPRTVRQPRGTRPRRQYHDARLDLADGRCDPGNRTAGERDRLHRHTLADLY